MHNYPFPDDINLKNDILLNKKDIKLYNEFNDLYSHHTVLKYRISDGKFKDSEYYLFIVNYGKSVMNYTPDDYYKLSEFLDISFDYTIFMTLETINYKDSYIYLVDPDYRLLTYNKPYQDDKILEI